MLSSFIDNFSLLNTHLTAFWEIQNIASLPITEVKFTPSDFPFWDNFISFDPQSIAPISHPTSLNSLVTYHYSIPTVKLAYPEPFIASASLMHSDLWFVHILVYQYWLWFVFVFIITFFFLIFLCTVRWCNMRIRPRRETRGVSRSKCGDLITACVPVSWATSIIVSESTDAIDYYDGFGTAEMVIGIRAYQWGWEYYYPKDLDLNYNLKQTFATMMGNSLKYNASTGLTVKSQNLWKFYQDKIFDSPVLPISLWVGTDLSKLINLFNGDQIGKNLIFEINAFPLIRQWSKSPDLQPLSNETRPISSKLAKIYETDENLYDTTWYGIKRQTSLPSSSIEQESIFYKVPPYQYEAIPNTEREDFSTSISINPTLQFLLKFPNPLLHSNSDYFSLFNPFSSDKSFSNAEKGIRSNLQNLNLGENFNLSLPKEEKIFPFPVLNSSILFVKPLFLITDETHQLQILKLITSQFDNISNPLLASQSLYPLENFDATSHLNSPTPTVFQGKDETIPPFALTAYFNTVWGTTTSSWRFYTNNISKLFESIKILPPFIAYYDYDFRNFQTFELLEDSFWEEILPITAFDEYREATDIKMNKTNISTEMNTFLQNMNKTKKELSPLIRDLFEENTLSNILTENSPSPLRIPSWRFNAFQLKTILNGEDLIESVISTRLFFSQIGKISPFPSNSPSPSRVYSQLINSFRSDFEEIDLNRNNAPRFTPIEFEYDSTLSKLRRIPNSDSQYINISNPSFGISEIPNLRNTSKNAIISANAIGKVFRNRYEDKRSHTKLDDFSNTDNLQPFISGVRPQYEKFLQKNANYFFQHSFFKSHFKLDRGQIKTSNLPPFINPFDMPFMIAMKSEASRYLWLDWYAKWSFVDIQPSSSSRYAIIGLPFFNKNFNFTANQNDLLNETETYFLRIARARKNYFPSWVFSPYFYFKNTLWFPKSSLTTFFDSSLDKLDLLQLNLKNELVFSPKISLREWQPSSSSTILYAKSFEPSFLSETALMTLVTNLYDILSKREYLYRHFPSIPIGEVSNYPSNNLIRDFKNLTYFISTSNPPLLPLIEKFNINRLEQVWIQPLAKNQYRPLRKGINNMLRLHATGAIAMPIEIRLQILASSKDVIHSWAIPSAGIKIDCVPGYSSHRITIFLVSGIFWGQCMEVCGRYHHWMPIVVYFMKRDLFFLWCTHFILPSSSKDASLSQPNFYNSNKGLVSFNKMSWLGDL